MKKGRDRFQTSGRDFGLWEIIPPEIEIRRGCGTTMFDYFALMSLSLDSSLPIFTVIEESSTFGVDN